MPDIQIDIYSRLECHLCDEAKAVIERVAGRVPMLIRVIDIETDPGLEALYGTEIPVIFINGRKAFKYRVDEAEFEHRVNKLWRK